MIDSFVYMYMSCSALQVGLKASTQSAEETKLLLGK